jgi:hypothetical protein
VAGYREGAKMSTEKGKPIPAADFRKIWPTNLRTLSTWCTIGADVELGKYAILGARMGCYDTVLGDANIQKVRDLDELTKLYFEYCNEADVDGHLLAYGESLKQQLDLPIADYDEAQSRFYRFVMPQHRNRGVQDRE